MRIELGKIIISALPLIEKQLAEETDKYTIEKEFRRNNHRRASSFKNVMQDVLKSWSVSDDSILLIEVLEHDQHCRAHSFVSIEELELHLLGGSSFLNWYITYVVPVVAGKVKDFEVYSKSGEKIIKHIFDQTSDEEARRGCRIEWKS